MPLVDEGMEAELKTIKENIIHGIYSLRENDTKNCKAKHWTTIRCVVNEENERIKNTYACSMTNCFQVFISNLAIEGTGKLRRHYQKCNHSERIGIDSFFEKEFRPPAAKRMKKHHKTNINDAAVSFVVNDLRPVDAVTKPGLITLLAVFTQIGVAYGKMGPEEVLKILPSRFSVSSKLRYSCVANSSISSVYLRVKYILFMGLHLSVHN